MLFVAGCWAWCQLLNGIRSIPVPSKLRNLLTLVWVVFIGTLPIPESNGRFRHADWTNPESDCGRVLGSMPASQWCKIHPFVIFIHEITGLNGVLAIPELDDRSAPPTAAAPILNLIAGGCQAQGQLHSRIMDVSVTSELMKSVTIIGVVFIGSTLALPELDDGILLNQCSYPGTNCMRLLARCQLPRGIRYILR